MKAVVQYVTKRKSILLVEGKLMEPASLTIVKTATGHSYPDVESWPLVDSEYYALEDLIRHVIRMMEGFPPIQVEWEMGKHAQNDF